MPDDEEKCEQTGSLKSKAGSSWKKVGVLCEGPVVKKKTYRS